MRRTHLAAGAVALGALTIPAVASAHTVTVTCENNRAVAQGASFPVSPAVTSAQLTVDGVVQPPIALQLPGPNPGPVIFPSPIFGQHTLIATFVNGGPWTSPATPVDCGEAPPPPPTPGPAPTGPPGPHPGALDQPVIGKPVKVTPLPKKKRTVVKKKPTRISLIRKGAGPKWFDHYGYDRPVQISLVGFNPHPPVTG